MAGKSSPALFELIRDPNAAARTKPPVSSRVDVPPGTPAGLPVHQAPPPPEPAVSTPYYRPSPAARESEPVPSTFAPAEERAPPPPLAQDAQEPPAGPSPARAAVPRNQPLVIPPTILAVVAAAAVLLIVVTFAIGYRSGFSKGDERATRELSLAAAPLTDPLTTEVGEGSQRPPATDPRSTRQAGAPSQPVDRGQTIRRDPVQPITTIPAVRAVLSPPEPDPRQAGLNYYAIVGQLDRESAQQIAAFLADSGVAALAIDTAARGSNNQRSYRVYGLQGMTGPELRSPARPDYENRISLLGVIWKRDHRGWTDFSQTNWERYQP